MNSKQPKSKLNRHILDEAADWFVDFRVGDVDSSARERFDLWLRQSPEHIRAYMEIANTYVALPALDPARKVDIQQLIAYARSEDNIVPFDTATQRADGNTPPSGAQSVPTDVTSSRSGTRRSRRLAIAAAAVLLVAIASTWLIFQRNVYTTGVGERRFITLSDGSTIDLNARSRVRIRFSKGERHVELVEGQALFGVAHDVSRPFIVSAGNAAVRAVGTQFDVYRKRSGTTVTVVEGRVAVFGPPMGEPQSTSDAGPRHSQGSGNGSASSDMSPLAGNQYSVQSQVHSQSEIFVSAGEQVTVTERQVAELKRTNIAVSTAWTQHRLIFDATPLSDVVDDFNRYNTRQLVVVDKSLDDFHVSGVYSSTDPTSLIRFLQQQPGIDVTETGNSVRITRK